MRKFVKKKRDNYRQATPHRTRAQFAPPRSDMEHHHNPPGSDVELHHNPLLVMWITITILLAKMWRTITIPLVKIWSTITFLLAKI